MKYMLQYDEGKTEFEAPNDAEAQSKAREFLTVNNLTCFLNARETIFTGIRSTQKP